MKKALLMISSLMLILLAGCCRDEEAIEKIPYGPIRFYGNVVDAFLTKATDNYFVIQDSIGIFMIKSGSQLSSTTILDGVNNYHYEALSTSATPEFVPTSPADTIYYPTPAIPAFIAYYPAKDTVGPDFLLPIDLTGQATVANIPPLDLLYSNNATDQTSNVVNLAFDHVLSYITFTIGAGTGLQPADLDGMSVTFNNVSTTADFRYIAKSRAIDK